MPKKNAKMSNSFLMLGKFALLTSVIILFVGAVGGDTNPPVVGVKPGDWVIYKVTRLGASNLAWIYPNAVWIKVEVLNVSGTKVMFQEICNNGEDESTVNFTGDFRLRKMIGPLNYFIPANMVPGNVLFTSQTYDSDGSHEISVELTLNDTVERNYCGITREVNQLVWSGIRHGEYASLINFSVKNYWDKTTGFLLETQSQEYYINSDYRTSQPSTFGLTVQDTNLWPVKKHSVSPLLLLVPAVAVPIGLAVAASVVLRSWRRSRKVERS